MYNIQFQKFYVLEDKGDGNSTNTKKDTPNLALFHSPDTVDEIATGTGMDDIGSGADTDIGGADLDAFPGSSPRFAFRGDTLPGTPPLPGVPKPGVPLPGVPVPGFPIPQPSSATLSKR